MIAKNVTPFRMKHHAVPMVVTRTPARAGPKMRDPVITAVFNEVAFGMSTVGTSSVTRPRRAGLSNALTTPSTSDSA